MQEYRRLLKLTKQEYHKLFQENKILKDQLNLIPKEKNKQQQIKDNIRNSWKVKRKKRTNKAAEVESKPEEIVEEKVKKTKNNYYEKIYR